MPSRQLSDSLISVVVPCFNEAAVIVETYRQLVQALEAIPNTDFELLFVDDGSHDSTLTQLRHLQTSDSRVRVVALSRNFGHQMAVTAGLEHAGGDAVVLIDADLQDPPDVIQRMVGRWRDGVEVAYGVRGEREGESNFKRWTASAFYRWINRVSDVAIPLDTGDFRLMDRKVVDALLEMPERDRFVRGMVAWLGFRQEAVTYRRAARFAGTTKYPLAKMIRFAADGILSFSLVPLRLAIWMGFTAAGLALLGIIYALVLRLWTSIWVPGWTLLFIGLSFIGGVQLVFLGIIGEYVGRVYGEVKRRPLYAVRERAGFPRATPREAPGSLGSAGVNAGTSRWLRLTFGLIFASLFAWLVLRRLNFAEVGRAIATIHWPVLVLAVLALALGYSVRIIRWWLMLRASDPALPLVACVRPLLISVAVNNVIPFRAGDALRVVGFRKQLAATPVRVFATLVAERVLDLTVLLAVFLVGVGGVKAGAIPQAYVRGCVVIACLGLLAWVVALLFAPRLQALCCGFVNIVR